MEAVSSLKGLDPELAMFSWLKQVTDQSRFSMGGDHTGKEYQVV